jgi:scyllo-inositol 2-dehydrogenase (NADP+)
MTEIDVAIIGYGLAARVFHAPLVASTPGLRVGAIVTAHPQRRREAAAEHPGARLVASADELWSEPGETGLVVVAAPNDAHVPLASAAVAHGLPVVVDKPLAPEPDAAAALIERARAAGVPLTVFQNRRWDSDQLTLRRLMADGQLGAVVRYESRFERWRPDPDREAWRQRQPPESGGGQLLDLGSHLVDQALVLFGPVSHVYAEIDARLGGPSDDDVFLALRHRSGVISHLRASSVTPAPGPRLRVLGSRAAFVVEELDGQEDALRDGHRPTDGGAWGEEPESRWGQLVTGADSTPVPSERGDWPRFYRVLEAALRDAGPLPVEPEDALTTLRILGLARRSAAGRRVIAVQD